MRLVPGLARRGFLGGLALGLAACSGGGGDASGTTGPQLPSAPTPVLTSVSIAMPAGTPATLVPGQTVQLSASTRDQSGNTISASVTWSSSAAAVATVSGSGLVSAVGAGTATVTATATSGAATVSSSVAIAVVAPPVLTSVTVAGTTTLTVGQTSQLTASPRDQSGNAITASVVWTSSVSAIASVSASGLVTAVAVGAATITATASVGGTSVAGTAAVTVQAPAPAPPVLTSVAISAPAGTVTVGETLQLTAAARDQFGNAIAATFTWSSSNASRATVSATGLVSGVSAGAVTISVSATAGGATVASAVALTVQEPPPVLTSVQISGGTSVTAGSTLQLAAAPRDQFGNAIAATVAWSSNATGVATVNGASGLVTGVSAGSANITALATMGSATASSFVTITVNAPAFPSSATVNTPGTSFDPASVDIAVGGTVTWNITGIPHNVTFAGGAGAPANIPTGTGTDSRTFNTVGTFNYSCTLHIGMNGTVVVH